MNSTFELTNIESPRILAHELTEDCMPCDVLLELLARIYDFDLFTVIVVKIRRIVYVYVYVIIMYIIMFTLHRNAQAINVNF